MVVDDTVRVRQERPRPPRAGRRPLARVDLPVEVDKAARKILARWLRAALGDDPARGLFDGIMGMHRALRKIERAGMDPKTGKGGKPVAAALHGTAFAVVTLGFVATYAQRLQARQLENSKI